MKKYLLKISCQLTYCFEFMYSIVGKPEVCNKRPSCFIELPQDDCQENCAEVDNFAKSQS